ncbi:MAG: hypothetical protein HPPSJP_2430 [Candidatus Hepatoplasma scabrum]|nr:MAG: hypothetical protein HPPSJP_2430 [Candidatus Hepatoplasma sp.]
MEIILNQFYNNFKIKTEHNIVLIYGENNSGKTTFINNFEYLLKRKTHQLFSNLLYEDNRSYLILNEEWELKKELNLQKKSYLYKFIIDHLIDFLEEKNIDLTEKLRLEKDIVLILDRIKNLINCKVNEYYIEPNFNFKNDFDLISILFKLAIYNQEEDEISEKNLSRSERLMLYLKLLIDTDTKNKIFVFDCIDSILNGRSLQEFCSLLISLRKNNLIILTTRNPLIIRYLDLNIEEILYLNKNQLNNFYIDNSFLLKNYFLKDNIFIKEDIKSIDQFNTKIKQLKLVAEKDDYKKMASDFIKNKLSYILLDFDIFENIYKGPLNFKSENERLRDELFFRLNEIKLNSKQEYQNEILKQIK